MDEMMIAFFSPPSYHFFLPSGRRMKSKKHGVDTLSFLRALAQALRGWQGAAWWAAIPLALLFPLLLFFFVVPEHGQACSQITGSWSTRISLWTTFFPFFFFFSPWTPRPTRPVVSFWEKRPGSGINRRRRRLFFSFFFFPP